MLVIVREARKARHLASSVYPAILAGNEEDFEDLELDDDTNDDQSLKSKIVSGSAKDPYNYKLLSRQ
jgi:hypothetical protein